MERVDPRTLYVPVGIVRILQVVLTCVTFSLVASVGHSDHSFWTWCMFTWCFCFSISVLILLLELTGLSGSLPISWDDFKAAFAMLATLMVLAASIIYALVFTCSSCERQIGACVTSCLAFILYAIEVGITKARPGELSHFLSTVPGLLKVVEAFVACIIFICFHGFPYSNFPGLQWCIAVYSICFIFSLLILLATIFRLLSRFPASLNRALIFFNALAALMYLTAVVIWPFYTLKDYPRPSICSGHRFCQPWDNLVVIAFMTCVNFIAYIVDTVYSVKLMFFVST
ncbi:myeloid-associated differentiation marker homolog [Genypterus blacodes]|uniref:myeloid-associated differentiation marker homolog n=1 Tax=Genypterus blacodes TaxID=154954 RepID=UPI003F761A48